MFGEIIEKLLTLKANLASEKEQKIAEVVQAVEEEFGIRAVKIDNMLNECGYVEVQTENVEAQAENVEVQTEIVEVQTEIDNNEAY